MMDFQKVNQHKSNQNGTILTHLLRTLSNKIKDDKIHTETLKQKTKYKNSHSQN